MLVHMQASQRAIEKIELMGALIHQNAAAFTFPGSSPGICFIIMICSEPIGNNPINPENPSESSVINELLQFLITRFSAPIEHHAEL